MVIIRSKKIQIPKGECVIDEWIIDDKIKLEEFGLEIFEGIEISDISGGKNGKVKQ